MLLLLLLLGSAVDGKFNCSGYSSPTISSTNVNSFFLFLKSSRFPSLSIYLSKSIFTRQCTYAHVFLFILMAADTIKIWSAFYPIAILWFKVNFILFYFIFSFNIPPPQQASFQLLSIKMYFFIRVWSSAMSLESLSSRMNLMIST